MVTLKSPEWLPPGFTVKIKYKDGRKLKYYLNVATGKKYHSKNEVIRCAADNNLLVTPQKQLQDVVGTSSIDKVDAISDKTNDSAAWLPNGWTVDEKRRLSGSTEGKVYKIYTELSTGSKFYSKAAITRYLNTIIAQADTMSRQDKIDNVDEPLPDVSLQILPMKNTVSICENRRMGNSLVMINNVDEPVVEKSPHIISMKIVNGAHKQEANLNSHAKINNVDEPVLQKLPHISMTNVNGAHEQETKMDTVGETLPEMSPQVISTTTSDGIPKKKKKGSSFVTVAIERTTADDLPSGWIKEIRTSKCGSRMRRDPYYIDPISGYMFRSKPDALRYLKTNDISSCAIKPLKREDDVNLIKNENPSSNPANQKLSMQKSELFLGEESNGGGESSDTKKPPESDTKTLKQKHVNHDSVKVTAAGPLYPEEKASCKNYSKNAETENDAKAARDVSKMDVKVITADVSVSSPMTDPTANQQLPESGGRNKSGSRKSKKRKDSSMPLRASKRLAGSEPEMRSNLNFNERSLRAALRSGCTAKEVYTSPSFPHEASNIPQTSNFEPAKEAVDCAVISEETRQGVNQLEEVEKPSAEGSPVPEEQSGAKANVKPLGGDQQSQRSQLCYDFGDSWSDPLEFALKTLRGELPIDDMLPIDDTLPFPSCFQEISFMSQGDGCLKPPQLDVSFQSGFTSHAESSKKQNAVDPPPATSPSFSNLGNIGFNSRGGFNFHPSTEVGKKDSQTKFNP